MEILKKRSCKYTDQTAKPLDLDQYSLAGNSSVTGSACFNSVGCAYGFTVGTVCYTLRAQGFAFHTLHVQPILSVGLEAPWIGDLQPDGRNTTEFIALRSMPACAPFWIRLPGYPVYKVVGLCEPF